MLINTLRQRLFISSGLVRISLLVMLCFALVMGGELVQARTSTSVAKDVVPRKQYIAMLDAGSSGTRIYIYDWLQNKESGKLTIQAALSDHSANQPTWTLKVEPGLSDFKDKPEHISGYLQPLIAFVEEKIGTNYLREVPIYLKATGGIRLLQSSDQQKVLQATQDYLSTTGFKAAKAAVITGEAEGVYAWIGVNYLMDKFGRDKSPYDTFGIVEMGGASIQLTYVPLAFPTDHQSQVTLGATPYHLYSYSYNGLGINSARKNFFDSDTCDVQGYKGKQNLGDFHQCCRRTKPFRSNQITALAMSSPSTI